MRREEGPREGGREQRETPSTIAVKEGGCREGAGALDTQFKEDDVFPGAVRREAIQGRPDGTRGAVLPGTSPGGWAGTGACIAVWLVTPGGAVPLLS